MERLNALFTSIGEEKNLEELRAYIDEVYEVTRSDKALASKSRFNKGLYKQHWGEIVPLYIYANEMDFCKEMHYRSVIGNQKFDAIRRLGAKETRIEITEYFAGKAESDMNKEYEEKGFGFGPIYSRREGENWYYKGFEGLVKKKASKNYDNTEIVFVVSYSKLVFLYNEEYEDFLSNLCRFIEVEDFGNNNVFLLFRKGHYDSNENKLIKVI